MYNREKVPCYRCEKRYPNCHCKCAEYLNWKKEWNKLKEQDYIDRGNHRAISDLHFSRFSKCTHRKG